jgi:hypothetical protein
MGKVTNKGMKLLYACDMPIFNLILWIINSNISTGISLEKALVFAY